MFSGGISATWRASWLEQPSLGTQMQDKKHKRFVQKCLGLYSAHEYMFWTLAGHWQCNDAMAKIQMFDHDGKCDPSRRCFVAALI